MLLFALYFAVSSFEAGLLFRNLQAIGVMESGIDYRVGMRLRIESVQQEADEDPDED
jgi:hypothetical protein